ncbi:hypothetical protein LCGC14_3029440, partial [marine sediment metagenome]
WEAERTRAQERLDTRRANQLQLPFFFIRVAESHLPPGLYEEIKDQAALELHDALEQVAMSPSE